MTPAHAALHKLIDTLDAREAEELLETLSRRHAAPDAVDLAGLVALLCDDDCNSIPLDEQTKRRLGITPNAHHARLG